MSDLFGHEPPQGSLFGDAPNRMPHAPAPSPTPDIEDIRRRLNGLLETARSAEIMPWPERKARIWQIVFPQMATWLPAEEAGQLCFQFAREIERLKAA